MKHLTVMSTPSIYRAGLISLLRATGFEAIDEADDIKQLIRRIHGSSAADMLIVGLARGITDIVAATSEIKAWRPPAKIVYLAPELDFEVMSKCFAAGASGYLLESIPRDALRGSLTLVSAGEKVFPSDLAGFFPILTSKMGHSDKGVMVAQFDLSPREIEILGCLAIGQSNKAIGRDLGIAEGTVKVHVKRILQKAQLRNRTQAALWAVAAGVPAHDLGHVRISSS